MDWAERVRHESHRYASYNYKQGSIPLSCVPAYSVRTQDTYNTPDVEMGYIPPCVGCSKAKMVKFERYFSATSMIAVLLVVLVTGFYYRSMAMAQLLASTEQEHVRLTHGLVQKFWPQFDMEQRGDKPIVSAETFSGTLSDLGRGERLLRLALYDGDGKQLGGTDIVNPGGLAVAQTLQLEVASNSRFIVHHAPAVSADRKAVMSLLALSDADSARTRYSLELISDVHQQYRQIEATQMKLMIVLVLLLSLFYGVLYVLTRILEHKETESRVHALINPAYFDELTGLPNRSLFYDRLGHAMAEADRHEHLVGVMYLDLDRFKSINDSLGHEAGDIILKEASQRLMSCIRASDTVARVGGDEFTLVLTEMKHISNAVSMAQKILESIAQPFYINNRQLYVTTSIGITVFPFDDNNIDKLIKNADTAMYSAKREGRNKYQFFSAEMRAQAMERLAMESNLRDSMLNNELQILYQPQVDMKSCEVVSVAAMLRWHHPERGLLEPEEFMGIAEESGLMVPLGKWMLQTACQEFRALRQKGYNNLPISISLSARQLKEKEIVQSISDSLRQTECDPQLFHLEITESLLMETDGAASACIRELTRLGVKITLHDFGVGYSPLNHLKRYVIDSINIDCSFIQQLNTKPDNAKITRAIVTMAHSLDIKVIAAGVETEEQFQLLREQGCDYMQGGYYSEPLPIQGVSQLLKQGKSCPRISA